MEFFMSRKIIALVFFAPLIFAFGCKSKKAILAVPKTQEIIVPTSTELLIKKVNSKENSFTYFSAKGQVSYIEKNSQQDFDVSIVMEKDKYIWMNVTVLFGIEAVRIKITNDSVIILDRLHRKCIVADYSYLKKSCPRAR